MRRSAASLAVFDPCVCGKAGFRTAGSADVRSMGNATPPPAGVAMPSACAPFASADRARAASRTFDALCAGAVPQPFGARRLAFCGRFMRHAGIGRPGTGAAAILAGMMKQEQAPSGRIACGRDRMPAQQHVRAAGGTACVHGFEAALCLDASDVSRQRDAHPALRATGRISLCEQDAHATGQSRPCGPASFARTGDERCAPHDASGHTVALTVAYNGAPFAGFARQAERSVTTVQGELEQALSLLYRREVKTACAGRTDAGVHALGQVVSFDLDDAEFRAKPLRSLQRSMNALVDDAISISAAEERPFGFSARFDAHWREYRYHICTQSARPVLIAALAWHLGGVDLDLQAMNRGAAYLMGEHDFKSFCMAASARMIEEDGRSTCRNVIACDVYPETLAGTPVVTVRVVGNAFLHSMVRTIVGTLVEVGRGKREPSWVGEVLAARDRSAAGQNAPAAGLTFWRVGYAPYAEAQPSAPADRG